MHMKVPLFFSENLWDSSRNINQVKKSEAFRLLMQSVKNAPPLLSHTSLQIGDTPELSRHQPLEKKLYSETNKRAAIVYLSTHKKSMENECAIKTTLP